MNDRLSCAEVIELVAAVWRLPPAALTEKRNGSSSPSFTLARHMAMAVCHEVSGQSLPQIGRAFGGRHHTTVLHAIHRHKARLRDPEYRALSEEVAAKLPSQRHLKRLEAAVARPMSQDMRRAMNRLDAFEASLRQMVHDCRLWRKTLREEIEGLELAQGGPSW